MNQSDLGTTKFSVATGNVGLSQYMFMWNNACGLNEAGKAFMKDLQMKMDALKVKYPEDPEKGKNESAQLGRNTVKDLVTTDGYLQYSTSPQREQAIRAAATQLFQTRPYCFLVLQEVSPSSVHTVCPENALITPNNAMFTLTLPPEDKVLESKLTRGNAILTNYGSNLRGTFDIEYDKPGGKDKKQIRRAPCSVFDVGTNGGPRVVVCSVQVSGYYSLAYQNKGKALDSFLASYKELQEKELFKYAVEAETRALQFNADIVVLAGDFNQCGNTNDHVGTVGLVPHKVFLERLGFFEDETAREPTTFDPAKPDHIPRRLDRVFFKVISDKWRVTGVNTRIVHPPATSWRLESLSDHALFVTADFQVVKTQNSKI